jgi:hypothetical protein
MSWDEEVFLRAAVTFIGVCSSASAAGFDAATQHISKFPPLLAIAGMGQKA